MINNKYDQLTAGAQALLDEETALLNKLGRKPYIEYTDLERKEMLNMSIKVNNGYQLGNFVAVPTFNQSRNSAKSHMSLRFYEIKKDGSRTNSSKAKVMAALIG